MIKGMNLDWRFVGAELARTDSKQQAEFFRGFIKECKTWGTDYQIEQQFAMVNADLTDKERDALGMLSFNEK